MNYATTSSKELQNMKERYLTERNAKSEMFAGDEIFDGATGEIYSKQEIMNDYNIKIEMIDKILDSRKENKKSKTDKEVKEFIKKELGSFYFIIYATKEDIYATISDKDLEKLCFLGTYMNYDNILMKTQRVPLSKKEVLKLLDKNEGRAYATYNKLKDNNFLIENEDETISINNTYFKKGKKGDDVMGDIAKSKELEYARLFENGIKNAEQYAIVIRLLKHLHREYNILCKTQPYDMNLQAVDPMTLKDITKILDYKSGVGNLKKKLKAIKVNGQRLFTFIEHKDNDYIIYVNPYIVWKGNQLDNIKFLLFIFKDWDNKENATKMYNDFIEYHTLK